MADEKPAEQPEALNIPTFYGTSTHIASTGSDVMLVFSSLQPSLAMETAVVSPVAAIHLSRGSAQDLAQALTGVLAALDSNFGKIDTAFAKERREGKK